MATPDPVWDPTTFQQTLAAFLDRQSWSQNRLANEIGISQTAVNRWFQPIEKDGPGRVTRPRPEHLQALSRIMHYPLSDLLRMCNYPVETAATGRRRASDPALNSLQSAIQAAYDATEDEERRRIGLDAIHALVQSVWANHPRRRTGAQRSKGDITPPSDGVMRRLSYA